MSRSASPLIACGALAVSVMCFGLWAVSARPASAQSAEEAVPPPVVSAPVVEKKEAAPSVVYRNPVLQNQFGGDRVAAGMGRGHRWLPWERVTPSLIEFLRQRDANILNEIGDGQGILFGVLDVDGDKKNDMVVYLGKPGQCNTHGCEYRMFFGNAAKRPVSLRSYRFNPVKGGFVVNKKFFALDTVGGERFEYFPQQVYTLFDPRDDLAMRVRKKLETHFPKFFEGYDRAPEFFYTFYDLNNDGRDEVIVRVSESHEDWNEVCEVNDNANCPLLIYAIETGEDPLRLIGEFNAHNNLLVIKNARGAYDGILVNRSDDRRSKTAFYAWDEGASSYVRQR